jgi:hypothetical protein
VQNNLEAILADANAIEAILQTKAFEEKVEGAIQLKVEQKSKEILEVAKATANSKIAGLTEELEALSLRRDSLENEIVAEEERLLKPLEKIENARLLLRSDFEKLATEASIVTELLRFPSSERTARDHPAESEKKQSSTNAQAGKAQMPSASLEDFFEQRFRGCLANAGVGLSREKAIGSLAGLLGCRAIVIPDVRWYSAFANSFSARTTILSCDPRWLTGEMFWDDCFSCFDVSDDEWSFLLIQNFNLSLPEIWMAPLLNVLSGAIDKMPSGGQWPNNIRLLLSPAPSNIGLPVRPETLAHFAGLGIEAAFHHDSKSGEDEFDRFVFMQRPAGGTIDIGQVGFSVGDFQQLRTNAPASIAQPNLGNASFLNARVAASEDMANVAFFAQYLGFDAVDAKDAANRVRCDWLKFQSGDQ